VTGTTRGIGQVMTKVTGLERQPLGEDVIVDPMGNIVSGGTAPSVQEQATKESTAQADLRKEFEYEMSKLNGNKGAAYSGYALGTILDPANLIGGLGNPTVKSIVTEGILTGGFQGFFDPNFTNDTWGNRAVSAAAGATGGGILGFGFGKVLKKLGWLEESAGKVAGKEGGELATDTVNTVNKEIDTPLNELTPRVTKEEPSVTPTPTAAAAEETIVPEINLNYDAKLPAPLAKAAPRYGRDVVGFESDLDRALYIVRDGINKSKADSQYMDWIKQVTGIEDESLIRKLGGQVKDHVKNTPDKGVIPVSKLSLPETVKPVLTMPTAPFAGDVSKLGNGIDPMSRTWQGLDNTSKNLYNIGRRFLDYDATGIKPKLSPQEQKAAFDAVKAIDPNFSSKDMPDLFRSYSKVLDTLHELRGKEWQAMSLNDLVKNKLTHEDYTDLFNKGVFDGCQL
jgi:hypothetical protein